MSITVRLDWQRNTSLSIISGLLGEGIVSPSYSGYEYYEYYDDEAWYYDPNDDDTISVATIPPVGRQ